MQRSILATALLTALGLQLSVAHADTAETTKKDNSIDEVLQIIGSKQDAQKLPGSSAVVDAEQITIEANTDINQLLKTVPGVYIREEDGQGLRPNIGIRAASGGNSSKVTLMEDGVLIAPLPYVDPAAYYFPEAYRMHTIEVLKGAPLLRYGPQTTGGVINMITTPIPQQNSGKITTKLGEHNTQDIHAYYGGRAGDFGFLIDTVQRSSAGFKEIDRSNRDAGFDIEDYLVKFSWTGERQSLLAKMQYSEQVSNETYAGLTDKDFAENPNRRYGLSEIDQMDNQHKSFSLTYSLDLTDASRLSAIAYRNEYQRDWFKTSTSSLINAANAGDAQAQAILDGTLDTQDLTYTHGDRTYESHGVELNVTTLLADHTLNVGARDHNDSLDRYQPKEVYDQINGSLVFDRIIEPTGGDNRLEGGDALSLWVTDAWQVTDALLVNLALRYEDVDTYRQQFATPERSDTPSYRSNNTQEWLPGASFTYNLNNNWQVLAGVHRGFSPIGGGATETDEPETSTNYEAGIRYSNDWFVEALAFRSDFNNQAEVCSLANPCSNGATSGSFVTGEAVVQGLEFQAGYEWQAGEFNLPVNFNYTFSDAEISANNPVTGVQKGDRLADIPEQTMSLRVGVEHDSGWNQYVVAKYMDETCVRVGCNNSADAFSYTDSVFVVDLISRYPLSNQATVFVKVDNLFDQQRIVSRTPHGARPNKPQTVSLGLEYSF